MHDPNMRNFYGRVTRIEETHRRGGGFEADGTLGMAYFRAPPRRRAFGWVMPMALVLMTIILIKAVILLNIGSDAYAARVATLSQGSLSDKIGAYVLQADPLTRSTANLIRSFKS